MEWTAIKNKAQYDKSIKRAMEIFQVAGDCPEGDELELLLVLIKDYEYTQITLPDAASPG